VAVGAGDPGALDAGALRDAAAAFALAVPKRMRLAFAPGVTPAFAGPAVGQAVVEGIVLARYRYDAVRSAPGDQIEAITVVVSPDQVEETTEGTRRGAVFARTQGLARDLANAPPSMLTADAIARIAQALGERAGLEVTVFGRAELEELGCGGLLGVNRGSVDEPRMVKLVYRPDSEPDGEPDGEPAGRLSLVAKGIMYDSGGIALKPADAVHATMKNDMSGAGAVLAGMLALPALGCRTQVTGFLMCTDNMPSGSALKLGDVITMRGGTTVEVLNSDAEGRLVMADALVLSTEEPTDAIVDIATLTGATMRALGTEVAGLFANDDALAAQISAAAARTDEPVWRFPLVRSYRSQLDSGVADMTNMGGPNAGGITAALFLEEFVAGRPWAHIDIAGTAQNDTATSWRPAGVTGFGARLLTEFALDFTPPRP
jgi:leucyl aminopeptidase